MRKISRLRFERLCKGLTQSDVAVLLDLPGLSQWKLSQLERGLMPTPEESAALSKFYEVDAGELFERREARGEASCQ